MQMKKNAYLYENVVLGAIAAAFAYLLYVARTSPSYSSGGDTASMTFPSWIFLITFLISIIKIFSNVYAAGKAKNDASAKYPEKTDIKVYITLAAVIAYAICWEIIGFSASTVVFVAAVSHLLRPSCSWLKCLAVALAVAIFMNVVFGVLFKVDFPEPLLEYLFY